MSAIIGRVLLAVGVAVVASVVYRIMENNRREQHSARGNRRRGTRYDADPDYSSRPSWGNDWADDDDNDNSQRIRDRRSSRDSNRTKGETEVNQEPTSVQPGCPICLDTFQALKRKGISIFSTPCGHLFCKSCLRESLRTAPPLCPSCRKSSPFGNCHQIFL